MSDSSLKHLLKSYLGIVKVRHMLTLEKLDKVKTKAQT
jgi:hypothetical protein